MYGLQTPYLMLVVDGSNRVLLFRCRVICAHLNIKEKTEFVHTNPKKINTIPFLEMNSIIYLIML